MQKEGQDNSLYRVVHNYVHPTVLANKNKAKSWTYGNDFKNDLVVISKDGTVGEIYSIMGLNIALPLKPKDKDILNNGKSKLLQKYNRHELPKGLNEETMNDDKYSDFIDEEFRRRTEGVWVFIKGYHE